MGYSNDNLNNLVHAAKEGDAFAQAELGAILVRHANNDNDVQRGFYWYCQAIKQGYVYAKWNAGSMLINGDGGIEKNYQIGLRLIEEAADAYVTSACLFIADCYLDGMYGKEINEELSNYWRNRAFDHERILTADQFDGKPHDVLRMLGLEKDA
jgi:TPR repeat protein